MPCYLHKGLVVESCEIFPGLLNAAVHPCAVTYAVPVPLLRRRRGGEEALRQQRAYKQILVGIGAMLGRANEAQELAYPRVQTIVNTWEGRPPLLDWDATHAPPDIHAGAGLKASVCHPDVVLTRVPAAGAASSSFKVCQPAQHEVSWARIGLQQPRC